MMFQALQPLLAERGIHILLSAAKNDKIKVYIEPVKKDEKEDVAFHTPFSCEGTGEQLDNELAAVLTKWVTTRAEITVSLRDSLAASEAATKAAAEEAKKKAAEKLKKPAAGAKTTTSAAKPAAAVPTTPSLLDGLEGDDDDEESEGQTTAETDVVPAPASTPAPVSAAPAAPVTADSQTTDTAAVVSAAFTTAEPALDLF